MNFDLLHRRIRGFRVANLAFGVLLLTTVFGVYLAKTMGGDQRSQIATVEREMRDEQAQIKLLRAEVAYLGRPERVQSLAETHLGLAPIAAARRVSLDELSRLAAPAVPAPVAPVAAVKP